MGILRINELENIIKKLKRRAIKSDTAEKVVQKN